MKKLLSVFAAALIGLSLIGAPAKAAYPDRPINIIIPFGPGGAVDIVARILAENLQSNY